jgi:membrane protein
MSRGTADEQQRGRDADAPSEIPRAGWRDILVRLKDAVREDRITLIAAGVAFYAMLALFPAMIVVVSIYGLAMDPEEIAAQVPPWVSCPTTSVRSSPASSTRWPGPPVASSA